MLQKKEESEESDTESITSDGATTTFEDCEIARSVCVLCAVMC